MKSITSILILSLLVTISCSLELPEPECSIGKIEVHDTNAEFIRLMTVDTIHFRYLNQEGQTIQGRWIEGSIVWECIGFTRRDEDFSLEIWTRHDKCLFIIPKTGT